MFVSLVFISLALSIFTFIAKGYEYRISILLGATLWAVLLTFATEFLSIFDLITFNYVLASWILTTVALVGWFFKCKRLGSGTLANEVNLNTNQGNSFSLFSIALIGGIAFIIITIGLTALAAPPNNWDSMTYHMARAVHWQQNHSVAHYPTHILRQLYQSPWAEFVILHFQILSNSDRLANLVQWFSMIGSAFGTSLLAKNLGANFRHQLFTAAMSVSIPMGILQGSSTQNDYVAAFWLVCFTNFVLLVIRREMRKVSLVAAAGCLGLAILTKGTAYIYGFPFLIWLLISELRFSRQAFLRSIITTTLIIILINLGHYLRNFDLFGLPITTYSHKLTNDTFTIQTLLSNTIRNVALHIYTPLDSFNNAAENIIRVVHKSLNLDISDPKTTWPGAKFSIPRLQTYEDTAGNPIHLFLSTLTISVCFSNKKIKQKKYISPYLTSLVISFLLFCFLLKWQPWNSRLHLPVFVLFSPLIGIFFEAIKIQKVKGYLVFIILYISLAWVFHNESRPILGNQNIFNTNVIEQYFTNRHDLQESYVEVANQMRVEQCSKIGLVLREDAWEYPLWVLLQQNISALHIEHVDVKNVSNQRASVKRYETFSPCAIISVGYSGPDRISYKGVAFFKQWVSANSLESVGVFFRAAPQVKPSKVRAVELSQ
ncbi:hypothetical protein NDA01_13015 [Trichocoleus desertorum AS-A10]|uniref:hypothetical protein n=1 Tax=Trichocoleus desertorum TaxID=1481672 RepID=UPI003298F696